MELLVESLNALKKGSTTGGRGALALLVGLVVLLVVASPVRAQETGKITGTVVDAESGASLPGVNVVVDGASFGAATDINGYFEVDQVPPGTYDLRASFIGYQAAVVENVPVTTGETTTVEIALQADVEALDEVVVVAYGTRRKQDLTGAVAAVDAESIAKTALTSLEQGIQGKVPGVQVVRGDAAPGGGMNIQIRGVNSILGSSQPLIVIDGIPIGNSGTGLAQRGASEPNNRLYTNTNILSTLSPASIESIRILKDASATALYGSRGANGVVLITTKDGSEGQDGQFMLNYSYSLQTVTEPLDLLNARQFAEYRNEAYRNAGYGAEDLPYGGRPGSRTPEEIVQAQGTGISWQNRIFRPAGMHDLVLGFSDGDDRGSYFVQGSLLNQEGVIKGSRFTRGGIRINLNRDVTDRIGVQTNLAVTRSFNDMVRTTSGTNRTLGGIVRGALKYPPIKPQVDSTLLRADPRARYEDPEYYDFFGANPLRYTDEVTTEQRITRAVGGLRATAGLVEGLTLDLQIGGNYLEKNFDAYYPRTVGEGRGVQGLAIASGSEYVHLVSENLLRYETAFGDNHGLDVLGGFTYEYNRSVWLKNEARNFPGDKLEHHALSRALSHVPTQSGVSEWTLASFLGRVNYSLLDRYLLTATLRADGSSKFAVNNKWAVFPALAFAWRVIDEPFMEGQNIVSNLKLRLSYGMTGNQGVSPYQSKAAILGVTTTFNSQLVPAVALSRLANDNLRWETTTQYNIGLDAGFFDQRLTATANLYYEQTHDLLQRITIAPNTGFQSALVNAGAVTNKGIELSLGADVLTGAGGGLAWNISGNFTRNLNEITDLGPVEMQFAGRLGAGALDFRPFIQKVGLPIGAIYGYIANGIFASEAELAAYEETYGDVAGSQVGWIRYKDFNGDGKLTLADRTVIGNVNPDFTWGLTNAFSYGNFDLSFLITGVMGADVINTARIRWLELNGRGNIPMSVYRNAWSPENPDRMFPQINQENPGFSRFSDLLVEDGTYVRLKNLRLGYNIDLGGTSRATVYLNANNLLTITDYSGYDPEVSAFTNAAMRGVDLGSYPQARTIGMGINLTY